jgi:methyl-accepting chemotaxis protein
MDNGEAKAMKILNSLRIGARLSVGFGVAVVLLFLIGGLAVLQVSRVYGGTVDLADNWLPSVQSLGDVRNLANEVRRTTLRVVLESDANQKRAQIERHDSAILKLNATLAAYEKLISSKEEQQLYNEIKRAWATFLVSDKQLTNLAIAGDAEFAQARALSSGESSSLFSDVSRLIEEDVELNRRGATAASAEAAANYHTTIVLTGSLIGIALLLCITIAVIITRSIVAPISLAVSIAETVARGDLTSEIEATGKDETSQLLRALRHMNERLVDVVGRVRSSSESIAIGSAQIAAGNTDLSQRTEEQAASLEETAASMEELTATVKQNTENARQGNTLASSASEIASRGGDVVGKVVETMHDISSSSAKVAEIISVIEGIAFQTNILALNAAVEAARAGEQGRGFAVVASEVRSLAQRSATAAKEIKDLIHQSVAKVGVGTALVDNAGLTMKEVVQSVKRVTDLMGEITSASIEQHTGIEQVNQAVMQMDEVTQQNAALVEEASAAAQSMAAQSSTLRELVAVFRLPTVVVEHARPIEQSRVTHVATASSKTTKKWVQPKSKEPAGAVPLTNTEWRSF